MHTGVAMRLQHTSETCPSVQVPLEGDHSWRSPNKHINVSLTCVPVLSTTDLSLSRETYCMTCIDEGMVDQLGLLEILAVGRSALRSQVRHQFGSH